MIEASDVRSRPATFPDHLPEHEANPRWNLYRSLVDHRACAERDFAIIAAELVTIHDSAIWRDLGFASWNEFLADPEINISRSSAYRLMQAYAAWKPFLDAGTITAEEYVAMGQYKAATLAPMVAGAEPERAAELAARARTVSVSSIRAERDAWDGKRPFTSHAGQYASAIRLAADRLAGAPDASEAERILADLAALCTLAIETLRSDEHATNIDPALAG